ncbi:MAG TPA: hypothetical protein V6D21_05895 [Candidatus Obscuribacterales bacterium]
MPTLANTKLYTWKAGGSTGNDSDYIVRLSNRYDTIAAELGLTAAAAGQVGTMFSVNDAVSKGLLIKLRMNWRKDTGKRYSTNIVCDANKVVDAMATLIDKDYSGGKIISVRGVPKVRYR